MWNIGRNKMKIIPKFVARRPISNVETYTQMGKYIIKAVFYYCPRCQQRQNAGPNYQPRYCDRCGQRINFDGITWKEEKFIGYVEDAKRRQRELEENERAGIKSEQIENRMV